METTGIIATVLLLTVTIGVPLYFIIVGIWRIKRGPRIQSGSLVSLKDKKELNVLIDFSQSKIMGMSQDDFIWSRSITKTKDEWREYWETACNKQFLAKFCIKANAITQTINLILGEFPNAQYTALFQVQIVDNDGATSGIMNIIDNESGEKIAILERFYGAGGRIGTLENLICDAMDRLGTKFGKYLNSELK